MNITEQKKLIDKLQGAFGLAYDEAAVIMEAIIARQSQRLPAAIERILASEVAEEYIRDAERLDHLEALLIHCPHAEIGYCGPDEDEEPVYERGFNIVVQGCETTKSSGATLRECIDNDRSQHFARQAEFDAERNARNAE